MWLPLAPRRPLYTTIPTLHALMPSTIAVAAFARSRARALIHAWPLALPSVRAIFIVLCAACTYYLWCLMYLPESCWPESVQYSAW